MKILPVLILLTWLACPKTLAQALPDCAQDLPPAQNAICIAQDYQKLKDKPEMVKAGNDLIKKGDRLFKNKKYQEAYKTYILAHDNLPMPYAYLRASESIFMDYATATHFEDENGKPTGTCLHAGKFATAVERTLANELDVGIALTKILQAGPPVTPAMIALYQNQSNCMKAVANQNLSGRKNCVQLADLRRCMGAP